MEPTTQIAPKELFPSIIFFLKKFTIAYFVIISLIAALIPLIVITVKAIVHEINYFWNIFF